MTLQLQGAGLLASLSSDWSVFPIILLCYAASSGLGFYAGLFAVAWLILPISRRLNGAPHEVGECVAVLVGPFSGRVSTIYEIAQGQGGQQVPRVDLGEEPRRNCTDAFEDYGLLRLSPRPGAGSETD